MVELLEEDDSNCLAWIQQKSGSTLPLLNSVICNVHSFGCTSQLYFCIQPEVGPLLTFAVDGEEFWLTFGALVSYLVEHLSGCSTDPSR